VAKGHGYLSVALPMVATWSGPIAVQRAVERLSCRHVDDVPVAAHGHVVTVFVMERIATVPVAITAVAVAVSVALPVPTVSARRLEGRLDRPEKALSQGLRRLRRVSESARDAKRDHQTGRDERRDRSSRNKTSRSATRINLLFERFNKRRRGFPAALAKRALQILVT
jgi:hypothetical protein